MRLIDADVLATKNPYAGTSREWEGKILALMVADMPTIDPVRHGKWERGKEDGFDQLVKCTACGEEFVCTELDIIDDLQWNYCPNCGAKMDEV